MRSNSIYDCKDIYRIIDVINEQDNPEVICLQEVARFIPKYCPAAQQDQLDILSRAFPDYTPVWGTGISWHQQDLPPQEFGNLTGAVSTTAAGGIAAIQDRDGFRKISQDRFGITL